MEIETEFGVIARGVIDPEIRLRLINELSPEDFENYDCAKLFETFCEIVDKKQSLSFYDLALKHPKCSELEPLSKLEGVDYGNWIDQIKSNGVMLRATSLVQEFASNIVTNPNSFEGEYKLLQDSLSKILSAISSIPEVDKLTESFLSRSDGRELSSFGSTGINGLDYLFNGFVPGWIYSIIAGSGVGKSMMGLQIFDECMVSGNACMYLSSEMDNDELYSRLVSRRISVPYYDVLMGKSDPIEKVRASSEINEIMKLTNSRMVDKVFSLSDIERFIAHGAVRLGTKLIVIDHIHNIRGRGDIFERVSNASHTIQELAQRYNVAIIVLAQVAKGDQKEVDVERVSGKGAMDLEEVSNVFMILDRNRMSKDDSNRGEDVFGVLNGFSEGNDPESMRIYIKKNRAGRGGKVNARVDFNSMIISDGK